MEYIELTGKTVTLLPLSEEHFEGFYEASKPIEIWDWLVTKIYSRKDAVAYMNQGLRAKEEGKQYPFVVIENGTGKIIGSTSYRNIQFDNESLEIGSTWYHPSKWRTAVNTECKYLLLQHAFETWKLGRIEFRTDERNARSRAAILRLGAVEEGKLRREKRVADGTMRNTMVYSILNDEWPSVKQRLCDFLSEKEK
ncbi:GNAT family N-acetyltransferase [Peribacillus loiseleuriae]|uniref:GNAT family N-acetyltransferase n=1 Tax=Peribacillus loiseleuriae TaxID=1679170 RepID=UPI003822F98E